MNPGHYKTNKFIPSHISKVSGKGEICNSSQRHADY